MDPKERAERYGAESPLEFSHTFTEYLGGMMAAGLALVDLYEDVDPQDVLSGFMPKYMAVKAIKLK